MDMFLVAELLTSTLVTCVSFCKLTQNSVSLIRMRNFPFSIDSNGIEYAMRHSPSNEINRNVRNDSCSWNMNIFVSSTKSNATCILPYDINEIFWMRLSSVIIIACKSPKVLRGVIANLHGSVKDGNFRTKRRYPS